MMGRMAPHDEPGKSHHVSENKMGEFLPLNTLKGLLYDLKTFKVALLSCIMLLLGP